MTQLTSDDWIELKDEGRKRSKVGSLWRHCFPLGFKSEFFEVFKLAWPAMLTSFFQFSLQTVSVIMCGHLAKPQLDAAGLANSMINVAGVSIALGVATACDTFFSQTFGSENKKKVGVYLQRSVIIMNIFAALLCTIHINIEPILVAIGQNPEISRLTANYLLCFLPGFFFNFNYMVLARYLQNQNILFPSLFCAIAGNIVNIISQYICIYVLKFSYLSSAVCEACALAVMMLSQLAYVLISKVYKPTWNGWGLKETFCDWGQFFKLGIAGIFMCAMEEWSFEIGTFVAGSIDIVQLGIQSILFQIFTMAYMVPMGLGIAVNIRVGQHLGAGKPQHAKTAYRVGLALAVIMASITAVIFVGLRNYIPLIFTTDEEIIAGTSVALFLSAGYQFTDGINAASVGVLRGSGRHITGAIVLIINYYLISLPIGISLALATPMKVLGLWTGALVGGVIEAIIFTIVIARTDWKLQCAKAALIAYGEGQPDGENDERQEGFKADFGEDTELEQFSHNEEEPLIRSKKRRQYIRSPTTSFSRRASLPVPSTEIATLVDVSDREFSWILRKRLIVFVAVLAIVATAVVCRVYQPDRCLVRNNSTMAEYAGVLPWCNDTVTLMFSDDE